MDTTTVGNSMFGNWSTFRRCTPNRPSTTKASMTITAMTGLPMETRVNHMAGLAVRAIRAGQRDAAAEAGLADPPVDPTADPGGAVAPATVGCRVVAGFQALPSGTPLMLPAST